MTAERQKVLAKELEDRIAKRTGFEKSFIGRASTEGCVAMAWSPTPIGIHVQVGNIVDAKLSMNCGHKALCKYADQIGEWISCSLEPIGDGWCAQVHAKDGRKLEPRIKLYVRAGFLLAICSAPEEFAGDDLFKVMQ